MKKTIRYCKKNRISRTPGKIIETTTKFLKHVEKTAPPKNSIYEWVKTEFPTLSERVAKDRANMLLNLGLTTNTQDGCLELTIAGEQFLKTQKSNIIYENLNLKYLGLEEILEILREKPQTLEEIAVVLKEIIGVNWKTNSQCAIRLWWLEELGIIRANGKFFSLNVSYSETHEKEEDAESLSHVKIQDLIVELGNHVKLVAQKEYAVDNYRLDVVWQREEEGFPAYIFEIHVEGNLSEALTRLKRAWRKFGNPNLFLITEGKNVDIARRIARTGFPEISDSLKICDWKEMQQFYSKLVECKTQSKKTGVEWLKFRKK
jgi:hypothetical protein